VKLLYFGKKMWFIGNFQQKKIFERVVDNSKEKTHKEVVRR